jgi:subfamily B ATP-binding cassette protein MsbA
MSKANTGLAGLIPRLKRPLPYFVGTGWALPALIMAVFVAALTEPMVPALMKPLLDRGFSGGQLDLWLVPVFLMGLFAVRGVAGFIAQYALAYMANHGMVAMRERMFARLQDAPLSLFAGASASSLSNTLVYEVQTGVTLLVNALLSLIKDTLTLVALILIIFPGVTYVMKSLSRRLHRITQSSQDATDRLAYVVEENVLAHRIVRLHEAQASQAKRFSALSHELRKLAMKATISASAMTPLTQMLAAAALSGVIVTALWQSASSGITVGGFAAFVTAMLMLVAPIKHLSEVASPITRGLAAVERGLDLIDRITPESGGDYAAERASGLIELRDVTVRYANANADALNAINLRVEPGETVALVGSSGSGKTTLVNLLPRFVDAAAGQVLLDGVELSQWQLGALRRQFAYVSQDVVMFNDTVAANVALGHTLEPARVRAALQAAQLWSVVQALPQGMDTRVGHNAAQLSGGQRQRLAIARALYKDAPVLILDEATSALDNESELAVKTALQGLMKGRTTLIIAHRLSTIEHADRILVMHHGAIVESGSHAQLLRSGGHYARLYTLASEGGLDALQDEDL